MTTLEHLIILNYFLYARLIAKLLVKPKTRAWGNLTLHYFSGLMEIYLHIKNIPFIFAISK